MGSTCGRSERNLAAVPDRRRAAAQPADPVGPGRRHAPEDPGRQPGTALWVRHAGDLSEISPPFPIDDGLLLNQLTRWVPDAATRRKILVDNPARLYGFDMRAI